MTTDNNTPPEPTDAELDARFSNYDALYDVQSPVQVIGNVNIPQPTLSTLPHEMRDAINAKLAALPLSERERAEQCFIREALEANSLKVRTAIGPGEGATEVQKADAETANRVRLLDREATNIEAKLSEERMIEDPVTGNLISSGQKALQGNARLGYQARLNEIGHEMAVLTQIEGSKQRAEALEKDKANYRSRQQQLAELQEADRRADKIASEDRINRMAEAKARIRKSNLG